MHNDLRQHKKIHLVLFFIGLFIFSYLALLEWATQAHKAEVEEFFFFKIWLHSMNCEDGRSAGVVQRLGGKHPEAGSRGKHLFHGPYLCHDLRTPITFLKHP